jgi:hypothetical protein
MPTTEFVSSTDQGSQLKVADFIKQPTMVQTVMTKLLDKQFIADALLRNAPGAPGGVVKYSEDESLFAEGIEIVAEYGEIPVAKGVDGTPRAVFTVQAGGALLISKQMVRRNDVDLVNKRLRQIKNAMVKYWDERFMAAVFGNASIPTQAVTTAWTDATSKIAFDVAKASETVMGQTDTLGNEYGFTPDTLLLNPLRVSALGYNDQIGKLFQGNIADKNPLYSGDTRKDVNGFRVMSSFRVPANKAVLLERKTLGFISDEEALNTTPMYEQRERQTHRSDTTRTSAVAIDAPKSAVILTGI